MLAMKVLSDFGKRILNWFKKKHSDKLKKVYAFERCLMNGLVELTENNSRLAVELNGARIYVWFPIDELTIVRIKYQVMLEFRNELQFCVSPFWVQNVALPRAFDYVLFILNDNEYYNVDGRLTKSFHKELCNKYHGIVRDNMVKSDLLT